MIRVMGECAEGSELLPITLTESHGALALYVADWGLVRLADFARTAAAAGTDSLAQSALGLWAACAVPSAQSRRGKLLATGWNSTALLPTLCFCQMVLCSSC